MANYIGDFAEDTTDITFAWDSNSGVGASVTRTTDGTVYVQKVGALASSSATAATVTKANPGVVTDTAHGLENGDEMFFYNMTEMTELNQTIGVAANKAADTFQIATTAAYGAAETTGGAWVQVNTAEVTDTEDYKGVTGSHLCVIDTSGDDYFEAGADYIVYLNAATIDGQVVNAALAMFSIENRYNIMTLADGGITAAKIGADAITNAKIADDAIAAENLKTGAISADAFAADAIVAATLATGAFTADAFAADAIVAATFATDSIAADALKADAVTEIVTGILAGLADGVALSTILERVNAYVKGDIARTTNTYVYKKEDGSTTSFTNVIASGGRNL